MNTFFFSFLSIASLHFLALIAPGPDFALVTRNALLYPRRETIYTALGIALGLSVHISYCVFGLVLVLKYSTVFFNVLKYVGAAYLIYIGIKSWLAGAQLANDKEAYPQKSTITVWQALRQGFFCNVLNPKAGLFFIGLFTLVIKANTPLWQQMAYCSWMVLVTFIWFSCVACFITQPNMRHKIYRVQPVVVKVLGVLLILMGIVLLFFSFS